MTRRAFLSLPVAVVLPDVNLLPPDSLAIYPTVTSAAHEAAEGYFSLMGEAPCAIVTPPTTELHRWLLGHRGQKIALTVREWRGVR